MSRAKDLVLTFSVKVIEGNINLVRKVADTNVVSDEEKEKIGAGNTVELNCLFEVEANEPTETFVILFASPAVSKRSLSLQGMNNLSFNLEIEVTKDNIGLIKKFFSEGKETTVSNEEEFEIGEHVDLAVSIEGKMSKYMGTVAELFNSSLYGKSLLKIKDINEKIDVKKYMNIAFRTLSKEEKKFIQEKFHLKKEALKICDKIVTKLGDYCLFDQELNIDNEEARVNEAMFAHITLLYLIPLSVQYYNSILDDLKAGRKMSAACLFRTLTEVYIDFYYLYFHKELSLRYLCYNQITNKWFLDAANRSPICNVKELKQEAVNAYNEFINRFKIMDNSELSTWSGISILKMAVEIVPKKKQLITDMGIAPEHDWLDSINILYSKYSTYLHPASTSNQVVFNMMENMFLYEDRSSEDFINSIFFDTLFRGWQIVLELTTAPAIFYKDDKKITDLIDKEVVELVAYDEKLEEEEKAVLEWNSLKKDFYGGDREERFSKLFYEGRA